MSISALRANDTEEKKALHHTDIDMSPKSVGIVFIAILIGLFITFYTFVSAGLPAMVSIIYIVVGILVAVLMGFFVANSLRLYGGLDRHIGQPDFRIGILGIIVSSLVVLAIGSSLVCLLIRREQNLPPRWRYSLPVSSSASLLFPMIICRISKQGIS